MPPDGPSPGDHQAVSGTLRDDWADVSGDLVLSAGPSRDDAGDLTWAVTGGTGAYRGAAGEVRISQGASGLEVTLDVTVPKSG